MSYSWEYWMVATRADGVTEYQRQQDQGAIWWTRDRREARRYTNRADARRLIRKLRKIHVESKLIHVRIRPRSERLFLAERLKAWEPVVRAAVALYLNVRSEQAWCVVGAVKALPKEHRP